MSMRVKNSRMRITSTPPPRWPFNQWSPMTCRQHQARLDSRRIQESPRLLHPAFAALGRLAWNGPDSCSAGVARPGNMVERTADLFPPCGEPAARPRPPTVSARARPAPASSGIRSHAQHCGGGWGSCSGDAMVNGSSSISVTPGAQPPNPAARQGSPCRLKPPPRQNGTAAAVVSRSTLRGSRSPQFLARYAQAAVVPASLADGSDHRLHPRP